MHARFGHDVDSDLHTFLANDFAMVHPHSKAGWRYLLDHFGADVMIHYETEDVQPQIAPDELPALIESATQHGLTVQLTESLTL